MKITTKITTLSFIILSMLSLEANSFVEAIEASKIEGYFRSSYQSHSITDDKRYEDMAVGGKIHIKTGKFYGVSVGASLYSSKVLYAHDNKGLVPFRGEAHDSYHLLGEAYLQVNFGNSLFKVGRQEIDTPFAQRDDIGMVPNTFEAAIFKNEDIEDTHIFLGQIQKIAGGGAEVVDRFMRVNDSKHMQVIGIQYEGFKDLELLAWYYRLEEAEVKRIAYMEMNYEKEIEHISFGLGLQYTKQSYTVEKTAHIYGGTLSTTAKEIGLTLAMAYNKVTDNAATSGFGGGPFFSNSEYLILDNAGKDAKALWYGVEYDASKLGIEGVSFSLSKVILTNNQGLKTTEVDLVTSYTYSDTMEIHAIFSKLKGINVDEDEAKHLRVFANYSF